MKRLLLSLVAFAFLTASANAATCFWVGGTGNYDDLNLVSWASSTGGTPSTCAATGGIPKNAGDVATFDGASGGGTVTVCGSIITNCPSGSGILSIAQITLGAFTGTIEASTNNPNVTLSVAMSLTGAGTKTLNMGSGTWTLSAATGTVWDCGTCTNLTLNAGTSTIDINYGSSPTATRTFSGGGKTYNNLSVTNTAFNPVKVRLTSPSSTYANWTFTNAGFIELAANQTATISGAITYNSTSSSTQGMMISDETSNTVTTLSVGGANALSWIFIGGITKAGVGSITCTNCFGNNNSGVTVTVPSGGGGGRIIGG